MTMKMMKTIIRISACLCLLSVWACTEEITIDAPEGRVVPVVEGTITNECKRHEVILS